MPLIIPSNSISGEFEVANSLRFNRGSSDYLSRSLGSSGNRKTWTWSGWVKRGIFTGNQKLFATNYDGGEASLIFHASSGGEIQFYQYESGPTNSYQIETDALHRDVSAWYHIVLIFDTTQGTSSDRIKLYVNGNQITSLNNTSYPTSNYDGVMNNSSYSMNIGSDSSGGFFDGYMAEVCFIDGQALTPTSFGEFDSDTGIWKPIDVSGLTFGTNGFYLDFENSGSLGADVSGNGNNFTVNNLTSIDQVTDSPTNNFATMNPLDNFYASSTFSEGNCKIVTDVSSVAYNTSTFGMNSGKWYVEMKATNIYNGYSRCGIAGNVSTSTSDNIGGSTDEYIYRANAGLVNNGTLTNTGNFPVWNNGDIISIAIDLDNNYLYFGKNGTWLNSGDPTSGSSGTGSAFSLGTPSSGFYYIGANDNDTSAGSNNTFEFNFGNPPFSITSGNSDGNGYGNFEYSVPSGYYALNTKNLAEYG